MKKKLGIWDDVAYSYRLMQWINQNGNNCFQVNSFSERESLVEYLEKDSLDFLFVNEDYDVPMDIFHNVVKVIYLTEIKKNECKENFLYKYQSAKQIFQEIKHVAKISTIIPGDNKTKFIGVYSPVGRIGKTSLAISLARRFQELGEVIYINLESFSLVGGGEEDAKGGLSDVLYYLSQGKKLKENLYDMTVYYKGVRTFLPVTSPMDLIGIDEGLWKNFFQELTDNSALDYVVVDFGENISCFLYLFELCSEIYMPEVKDCYFREKMTRWEKFIRANLRDEIMGKIIKVDLPYIEQRLEDERLQQVIGKTVGEMELG